MGGEGRWRLVSLLESVAVAGEETAAEGEARFLREPFCLTTLPFKLWFDLLVFRTLCNLCCLCCTGHAAMLWPPSWSGQSPVKVVVRGSRQSLTGALFCGPPPKASLSAMVHTDQAWRWHCHSSEKQQKVKERSLHFIYSGYLTTHLCEKTFLPS